MQTAERPQHAPDHLQSQTVKLRELVEEKRVHRPARREGEERRYIIAFNLTISLKRHCQLELHAAHNMNSKEGYHIACDDSEEVVKI